MRFDGSGSGAVRGYLKRVGSEVALDLIGRPVTDGTFHLVEGNVDPGDELDGVYVVWEEVFPTTYRRYVVRRIPRFEPWSRLRLVEGTADDDETPNFTTVDDTISVFMADLRPSAVQSEGGVERSHFAAFVTAPDVLVVGDKLRHPLYEQFTVVGVEPYGPYTLSVGRAS